jgi:hypothetical protein
LKILLKNWFKRAHLISSHQVPHMWGLALCTPSLYKGGPQGRGVDTTTATFILPLPGAPTSSTSLSLFSLARLPEGLHRGEVFTTAAHRRATEFPDPFRIYLLPQSLMYQSPKGHHWSPHVCKYAEVLPMWHQSRWAEFFTTLRSATSATSSMLVREHNPAIGLVHHWSSDRYNITNR